MLFNSVDLSPVTQQEEYMAQEGMKTLKTQSTRQAKLTMLNNPFFSHWAHSGCTNVVST